MFWWVFFFLGERGGGYFFVIFFFILIYEFSYVRQKYKIDRWNECWQGGWDFNDFIWYVSGYFINI